jgi:hypothetical protein
MDDNIVINSHAKHLTKYRLYYDINLITFKKNKKIKSFNDNIITGCTFS